MLYLYHQRGRYETMDEKMDLLMYMIENGFETAPDLTMDDYLEYTTVEALREFCGYLMGENPTA